jgi:hypothetical protein
MKHLCFVDEAEFAGKVKVALHFLFYMKSDEGDKEIDRPKNERIMVWVQVSTMRRAWRFGSAPSLRQCDDTPEVFCGAAAIPSTRWQWLLPQKTSI